MQYCSGSDTIRRNALALITNENHQSVDSFQALNAKIMADQIQAKYLNVSFVQIYEPPTKIPEEQLYADI